MVASLYVHVPFCKVKCPYCDFYSVPSLELRASYSRAVLTELSLRLPAFTQFPTVYFGGGTPSLMETEFFSSILKAVGQFSEVTVEMNPEDVKRDYLKTLREMGVNRISLGIQSFSDRTLRALGKRQDSRENLRALEEVLSVFHNVSADLIYGAPGQTLKELQKDLETLLSFPVKHVSTYALTLYKGTPFYSLLEVGKLELPPEDSLKEMYYLIKDVLESAGFEHYEISNFCREGFEAKHNLSYWKLKDYVGIGPSAASYVNRRYTRNVSDVRKYIEALERGEILKEETVDYTEEEEKELKLIMGMRLLRGVNLEELGLKERFEEAVRKEALLQLLIEEGYLVYERPRLSLGVPALFVSNTVIGKVCSVLFG
ncbi:MAG: coproporphyrinogen III oxidase family protein [Desulfurobacterium sp.]|nr:MAG: coproporphyrinogen III oxidase family protein [Desulfurobacterium sp.]